MFELSIVGFGSDFYHITHLVNKQCLGQTRITQIWPKCFWVKIYNTNLMWMDQINNLARGGGWIYIFYTIIIWVDLLVKYFRLLQLTVKKGPSYYL